MGSESLSIFLKGIGCVFYHSSASCPHAHHWVSFGILHVVRCDPWNRLPVEEKRQRLASCGVPDPFWGTTMACTLVEPQPGAPYTPCLALSISQHCPCSLAKQPAQHGILFKQFFSNLQCTWGLAKALLYRMAQTPPNLPPYCMCSSSPPLAQRHIPLSAEKTRFITSAMESYNNRPMKIAKVVATLPSNYTCDKFIYLLVQQLNLHPH